MRWLIVLATCVASSSGYHRPAPIPPDRSAITCKVAAEDDPAQRQVLHVSADDLRDSRDTGAFTSERLGVTKVQYDCATNMPTAYRSILTDGNLVLGVLANGIKADVIYEDYIPATYVCGAVWKGYAGDDKVECVPSG